MLVLVVEGKDFRTFVGEQLLCSTKKTTNWDFKGRELLQWFWLSTSSLWTGALEARGGSLCVFGWRLCLKVNVQTTGVCTGSATLLARAAELFA